MAQLRVAELAKELGLHKHELVTKINGLGLGIQVNNPMTYLSPTEVVEIKSALNKGDGRPKVKAEPPKVRAKRPKADDAPKAAPVEDATPVAPIRRRRKITITEEGDEKQEVSNVVAPRANDAAPAEEAPAAPVQEAAVEAAPVVVDEPEPAAPVEAEAPAPEPAQDQDG